MTHDIKFHDVNKNASGTITTNIIWKMHTSSVRKCLIMSSLIFILLTQIILLSSLTSTGVADWWSRYWIPHSLISVLPALQLTTVVKQSLVAELANYQQRKLDFDLIVKHSEIQCLVYILSIHLQYKWSCMYHITFALVQSWLYCHPKHLNRILEMEGVGDLLHQADHHCWTDEPNLQCSLCCD